MTDSTTTPRVGIRPWPTLLGLAVIWVLTLSGHTWIFAVLFLGWALFDLVTGESHFIQRVTRGHNPITFWAVVTTWIAIAVLWLIYPS